MMPYPVTHVEATWVEVIQGGVPGPWLSVDPLGNLYLLYCADGNCYIRRKAAREATWTDAVQVTADGTDSNPAAALLGSQKIVAAVDRTDVGIQVLLSSDAGATWTEGTTLAGQYPFLYRDAHMTYMVYYDSGAVKVRRSLGNFSSLVAYTGGDTATVASGVDEDRPAGRWVDHTGKHEVALTDGGSIKVYESADAGQTWTLKATL